MIKTILNRLKRSYFIVNKLYLWIIFLLLLGINGTATFLGSIIVFLILFFTRRVPLEPKENFSYVTYVYKKTKTQHLKLDIWYPNEKADDYPVVFFAHGGGWVSGFRNQPNNVSWSKYLASKGFAVVSIDYRYGINNEMEDILGDYSDALEYIKTNYKKLKLDSDHIFLMGLSAGGHLALLYAAYYTCNINNSNISAEKMRGIKGVVAFYSPSNLRDIFKKDNKSLFARFATMTTLKGMPNDIGDVYEYYSPINWVNEKMVPVFLAHGKKDEIVPFNSSVNLAKRLKIKGIKYNFFVHKKGNHTFEFVLKDFQTVRILEHTVYFLKGLLKDDSRF
ncbi:MAG TPA: alpha/beta hydrolase [Thermotogota bacterium]|nr:alpha/beta hydrolase [Thermotogota bacterium]HPJ88704.1 alpha/beta hydrolase [Thermotogota bacterium]HPR95947.1 alpha/beta hydrolase [Thermotogota bacterium]